MKAFLKEAEMNKYKFGLWLLPFWGFFGHRLLNEMAVYTLPPPLIAFYKQNLDYIRDHAVDPDKRRYAVAGEAEKHFIDLDQWGLMPFEQLPRRHEEAFWQYGTFEIVTNSGDSLFAQYNKDAEGLLVRSEGSEKVDTLKVEGYCLRQQFYQHRKEGFPEKLSVVSCLDSIGTQKGWQKFELADTFSRHGILPYNLYYSYQNLIRAFAERDEARILRLSADIGHYIGDAHVPLHTTRNYNGQLSGQDGIHAFWESRLPELLAGQAFDFFVGKADLIPEKPMDYFWQIVLDSHLMVDSVLNLEAKLSKTWPENQQYCFEKRGNTRMLLPCADYSRAYDRALNGQVGRRMRAAVKSIADTWYSAWVAAGQPDLNQASKTSMSISQTDSVYLSVSGSEYEHLARKHKP